MKIFTFLIFVLKNELESLREMTLEIFKNYFYVPECEPWLSKDGFCQLFALFGRNSQGIGTSPFSVYVNNLSKLNTLSKIEKKKLDRFIDKLYSKLEKSIFYLKIYKLFLIRFF